MREAKCKRQPNSERLKQGLGGHCCGGQGDSGRWQKSDNVVTFVYDLYTMTYMYLQGYMGQKMLVCC